MEWEKNTSDSRLYQRQPALCHATPRPVASKRIVVSHVAFPLRPLRCDCSPHIVYVDFGILTPRWRCFTTYSRNMRNTIGRLRNRTRYCSTGKIRLNEMRNKTLNITCYSLIVILVILQKKIFSHATHPLIILIWFGSLFYRDANVNRHNYRFRNFYILAKYEIRTWTHGEERVI